jgi:hypothetical protein
MDKTRTTITRETGMPADEAPNIVAYRVGQLEQAVKDGFKSHNDKLDELVNNFASVTDLKNVSDRVSDLENDRKWLIRLVVGAVVFAVLSLIGVGFKTLVP